MGGLGAKPPAGSRGGAPGRRFVLRMVWRVVVVVDAMCGCKKLCVAVLL